MDHDGEHAHGDGDDSNPDQDGPDPSEAVVEAQSVNLSLRRTWPKRMPSMIFCVALIA